jgi:hypothetical protein
MDANTGASDVAGAVHCASARTLFVDAEEVGLRTLDPLLRGIPTLRRAGFRGLFSQQQESDLEEMTRTLVWLRRFADAHPVLCELSLVLASPLTFAPLYYGDPVPATDQTTWRVNVDLGGVRAFQSAWGALRSACGPGTRLRFSLFFAGTRAVYGAEEWGWDKVLPQSWTRV